MRLVVMEEILLADGHGEDAGDPVVVLGQDLVAAGRHLEGRDVARDLAARLAVWVRLDEDRLLDGSEKALGRFRQGTRGEVGLYRWPCRLRRRHSRPGAPWPGRSAPRPQGPPPRHPPRPAWSASEGPQSGTVSGGEGVRGGRLAGVGALSDRHRRRHRRRRRRPRRHHPHRRRRPRRRSLNHHRRPHCRRPRTHTDRVAGGQVALSLQSVIKYMEWMGCSCGTSLAPVVRRHG